MHHIRDTVPELKVTLMRAIHDCEHELAGYGDPIPADIAGQQGALLLHLFSKFTQRSHPGRSNSH